MSQHRAILLLGSNKGDTKKNLESALELLEKEGCNILRKSKYLKTVPVEFVSSNFFRNIAISINTHFSPIMLLNRIKQIENALGRTDDSSVYGTYVDRVIDIDIVTFDNLIFEASKLKIPHKKHLFERDFSKELLINLGKQPKT